MPNELPLPDELQHLIEKRSDDEPRVTSRRDSAPTASDAETAETAPPATDCPQQEPRSPAERRQAGRRQDD